MFGDVNVKLIETLFAAKFATLVVVKMPDKTLASVVEILAYIYGDIVQKHT